MELFIAFGIFIASMLTAVITGYSMILPLLVGLVAFMAVGKIRGFSLGSMAEMSKKGIMDSIVVIKVMLVILTAVWRVSGTITVFVYYGMKVIMPPIFLIVTFALCCLLSYAIGTSFGIAGTVGVIFIALARSGGVDPVIAAGVIIFRRQMFSRVLQRQHGGRNNRYEDIQQCKDNVQDGDAAAGDRIYGICRTIGD